MIIELYGCPGCGKTYLIQRITGQTNTVAMSDSNIKNMLINIAKKTSLLSPKSMRLNRKILSCVKNENDKPLYVNKVVEYFVRNIVLLSFGYRHIKKDMFMAEGLVHRVAKAVNFGILYGMSRFGLSDALDININDATEFISKYKSAFPGIDEYMKGVIKDAHEKGYVKTIMNRKRIIEEINNTNHIIRHQGERIALNTPIQGSSADIIKKAMIDLHRALKDNNFESKMILQIHDELIFDVKKEEEEKLKELVKNVMENCYKLNVPLEVEINTGINWYDAK